jgi:hypothetical protein
MRHFILFLLPTLLCSCVMVEAAEEQAQKWVMTLALHSDQTRFTLHEPVPVMVTWRNISSVEQTLQLDKPTFIIEQSGIKKEMRLYETIEGQRADRAIPSVKVKSQESFRCSYWLILGAPVESTKWKFLFDKEGEWSVAWPSEPAASVKFTVSDPREADKKAFSLFSKDAAAFFLREYDGPAAAKNDLDKITTDHPDSVYASYAVVAMGRREQYLHGEDRKWGKLEDGLKKTVTNHPRDLLGETAQNLLIEIPLGDGDYAKATERYVELKKNFPKSMYLESHRLLEGAAPIKVTFRKPEQNDPTGSNSNSEGSPGDKPIPTPDKVEGALPKKVAGQATLKIENTDKIPKEIVTLFEEYWRGWVAEDTSKIKPLVGDNYLIDGVDVTKWDEQIRERWKNMNLLNVMVEFHALKKENEFSASTTDGQKRQYRGPLYLVTSEITIKEQELLSGVEKSSRWIRISAVAKKKDRWIIMAEDSEPRKSVITAQSYMFRNKMENAFGDVSLNTKEGNKPIQEILRRELKIPEGSSLQWASGKFEITGETMDIPVINGELTAKTPDGHEVKLPVAIRLTIKDRELYLDKIIVPEKTDQPPVKAQEDTSKK